MAAAANLAVRLDRPCPGGTLPTPDFFKVVEVPEAELESENDGSILVQTLVASADPYLRGAIKTMAAGATMEVFQAGRVLASNNPAWAKGDLWGGSIDG